MLPVEIPPEPGAEGFLMDLEFAHIERNTLDITTQRNVSPERMPGGATTTSAISTEISFGPVVLRGAAMTVNLSCYLLLLSSHQYINLRERRSSWQLKFWRLS
jgi:hypothetical protein